MHDPALEQIVRARQSLSSNIYELKVIQSPGDCRALAKPSKLRGAKWPLEPPPVVELVVRDNDPNRTFLHSPFYICIVSLDTMENTCKGDHPRGLAGTTSSSLHKVKLTDSREERGFFVFGDLNVMNPGLHRLKFALYEIRKSPDDGMVQMLATAKSEPFKVFNSKAHIPPKESTPLSKQLCEAGVKLRIRKETSNKRRGTTFQWAADRNQILPPGAFPSRGGTGPTRIMAGSTRLANGTPGVDIRDRLTLSTGNSLGIRSHMDHSMLSNRSDSAGRSFDPWTTSQPSYDSHPAYTTPMPSYHQANPTFSMPPTTTSSYELHSGYAPYSDITYQTPRHSMPPANYNTSSNIHPQSDQDHLAGNDHSYFSGSNAYSQMHSGGAMDGFDHHETGHVPDFPASFTNSTSMASNGPDQDFSFAGMGEGPKSHQNGHYMDSGDPFQ